MWITHRKYIACFFTVLLSEILVWFLRYQPKSKTSTKMYLLCMYCRIAVIVSYNLGKFHMTGSCIYQVIRVKGGGRTFWMTLILWLPQNGVSIILDILRITKSPHSQFLQSVQITFWNFACFFPCLDVKILRVPEYSIISMCWYPRQWHWLTLNYPDKFVRY